MTLPTYPSPSEELSAVSARLVVLETSYSDVVPLRELKLARAETERVRAEGEDRLAELQQVLQQEREMEALRTPRPDWSRSERHHPTSRCLKAVQWQGEEINFQALMLRLEI